jgi:hypothetical protein
MAEKILKPEGLMMQQLRVIGAFGLLVYPEIK